MKIDALMLRISNVVNNTLSANLSTYIKMIRNGLSARLRWNGAHNTCQIQLHIIILPITIYQGEDNF